MKDFHIAPLPELVFGSGALHALPKLLERRGITRIIAVTGGASLDESGAWEKLSASMERSGIAWERCRAVSEPSPSLVDSIAEEARAFSAQGICGIGGGSVIDAAKAAAAMAEEQGSVREYLEGVGTRQPSGRRLFLSALPTTAGTGSEATKNAVISETGENGFKKSLRHDRYVPDAAVLDPLLALGCPPGVTAASGLDAVTQLLESYISVNANAFTDTLALEGLAKAGRSFLQSVRSGRDEMARGDMAYAAYLSGITLANAGLGVVHGAAGVLGGLSDIPHGTVCGTLLYESTRMIIKKLEGGGERARYTRKKLARAGYALTGTEEAFDYQRGMDLLLQQLAQWQDLLEYGKLSSYGISRESLGEISRKVDSKQSPVSFDPSEIEQMLASRL